MSTVEKERLFMEDLTPNYVLVQLTCISISVLLSNRPNKYESHLTSTKIVPSSLD